MERFLLQNFSTKRRGVEEMADVNRVDLLGRLGNDVEIRTTQKGREIATFSIAVDTGYYDKDAEKWKENLHWHKIVTFQEGLISVLRLRGKKGVRVLVTGELTYNEWQKEGETSKRKDAEILVGNSGSINFLDREKTD
jgi:single-strand DNA-binding protein